MAKIKATGVMADAIEAGGIAHVWWRVFSSEPSDQLIASSIFHVMQAVLEQRLDAEECRAHLNQNTGGKFFYKFAEGIAWDTRYIEKE